MKIHKLSYQGVYKTAYKKALKDILKILKKGETKKGVPMENHHFAIEFIERKLKCQ